jgi:Ca2+-binding EF-hand superfamily protein
MPSRRNLQSLLLLLAASTNTVLTQPPNQQKTLQPLGDALLLTLDKDKNEKVTLSEVESSIATLELLFQNAEEGESVKYKNMLVAVKAAAPTLFELLDSNSNKELTKAELSYFTKFEKSLKKDGGMRDFLRDVFGMLDSDKDDLLTADELFNASQSSQIITDVTVRFHKLFPLRKTPDELEEFVKKTIESIGGTESLNKESVKKGMKWIDDDGDGVISRKEVGKYYNVAGKAFMDISKSIKTMGPMLALFSGMDTNGGGGFKMDL